MPLASYILAFLKEVVIIYSRAVLYLITKTFFNRTKIFKNLYNIQQLCDFILKLSFDMYLDIHYKIVSQWYHRDSEHLNITINNGFFSFNNKRKNCKNPLFKHSLLLLKAKDIFKNIPDCGTFMQFLYTLTDLPKPKLQLYAYLTHGNSEIYPCL